jgi:hypothetical protein
MVYNKPDVKIVGPAASVIQRTKDTSVQADPDKIELNDSYEPED